MITRRGMMAGSALALMSLASTGFARAEQELHVGVVLPLTGPASEIGNVQLRGLEFAAKIANEKNLVPGHKIVLHVEDNQARADLSVVAFNKLVSLYKVPLIMGGYSGPSLAMAPLATRNKVVVVNGGAQSNALADASPYLFNTVPQIRMEIQQIVRYLREEKQVKSAAMIYVHDAQGEAGRDSFKEAFEAAGGKLLGTEPIVFGETNFRGPLTKIAALKPDALFTVMTSNFIQLAEQRRQLKLDVIMAGNTSVNQPSLIANPAAEGWYHPVLRLAPPKELSDAFTAEYGIPMTFYPAQYYNTLTVFLQAAAGVLARKQEVTGENIRNQVIDVGSFEGIAGAVAFKSNTALMPFDIKVIEGGEAKLVKTYEQ